ncbi:hypothetical protein NPIL_353311 [Nephila pilipes]|uniref:Uncharacterized protein n=1 Tax=Nephila pilipes TaxID=299642 RepID=A0A8X6PIH7_NEPPI|nr:hypothetical protein NPIL_353311 [Nephila pilipes]
MIFDLMIQFIDYSVTQFLNRVTSTQETTADAALIPFPTVQKTCGAQQIKSKLVPPQGTTTVTETLYERKDQVATVPVVRSIFVWKMCQALDLPATFVLQESDTTLFCKEFKVNQPIPIVYSVAVFEMFKTLELKAQLASHYNRSTKLEENFTITGLTRTIQPLPILMTAASENLITQNDRRYSKPTEFCDYFVEGLAARESWSYL